MDCLISSTLTLLLSDLISPLLGLIAGSETPGNIRLCPVPILTSLKSLWRSLPPEWPLLLNYIMCLYYFSMLLHTIYPPSTRFKSSAPYTPTLWYTQHIHVRAGGFQPVWNLARDPQLETHPFPFHSTPGVVWLDSDIVGN